MNSRTDNTFNGHNVTRYLSDIAIFYLPIYIHRFLRNGTMVLPFFGIGNAQFLIFYRVYSMRRLLHSNSVLHVCIFAYQYWIMNTDGVTPSSFVVTTIQEPHACIVYIYFFSLSRLSYAVLYWYILAHTKEEFDTTIRLCYVS